jgi:hypothetical protein
MGWDAQIFAYCERGASAAFWAEPLNALSNVAFILSAGFALGLWIRQPTPDRGRTELGLIALVFVIGIGSFLFHTFATRWAALADTLPITAFMLLYLLYALLRYVQLGVGMGLLCILVFIASLAGAGSSSCGGGACLNGSAGYVPALVALLLVGAVLGARGHPAGSAVLLGAGVFLLSLVFRTADRTICPRTLIGGTRIGTHFIWHLLNATLLYILLRAAIRYGRTRAHGVNLEASHAETETRP